MATKQKGGSVVRSCEQCGCEFSVWLSTIAAGKGHCCSSVCSNKLRTGKPSPKSKTRSDKKPRTNHVCQWCGKVFTEQRRVGRVRQFCSNSCSAASKRKLDKAPSKRNQVEHVKWSLAVILRDRKCVRCGAREKLQAHHVKPFDKYPELAHDVSNGVALCPCCHHAQHPSFPLETFVRNGGKSVCHCVVCESPFVPRKSSQRTCSLNCGHKLAGLRRRKNKSDNDA